MTVFDCVHDLPFVLTNGVLASPGPSDSGPYQYSHTVCTETSSPAPVMTQEFIDGLGDYFHVSFIFYFLLLAIGAFFLGQWLYKR